MTEGDPIDVVVSVAEVLDLLDVPYALGGSLAASFFGEPRATADVDVAISIDPATGEDLLARAAAEFYVPLEAARRAIRSGGSFNLVRLADAMKVDLFVLGDGILDRRQIERRVRIALPGGAATLWVTSPEDQVLRKLDWFRLGGSVSDRQWRDVLGILRIRGGAIDEDYLRSTATATATGLAELVERAISAARAS